MEQVKDASWFSGLDSISFNLGQGYYQWAQNVTNRGGILGTRQGLAQITGRQGSSEVARGLALFAPWRFGINPILVAAIGDSVYALQYPYTDALDDSHKIPNISFPTSTRSVQFEVCVQAQKNVGGSVSEITPRFVLMMQDGITPPAYYYFDTATLEYVSGHVNPSAVNTDDPPWNTPIGTYMKWIGDRLWVAVSNKVHASDLLNPLQFEEEKVTASGGFFYMPGEVTGMGVTHDFKSLLVGTDQTVSAFQAGIEDRDLWPNTQDFQRVIFPNIGIVSNRSVVNQYGMTWWMSHDGVVALDTSLQAYQTSRMQVRDHNMSRSKEGINWVNGGGCAGTFGNWLFFSVPSGSKYNQHTWVMDQSVLQNLNTIAPPAWCSIWTGIRPEQWVTGTINGIQRCFCISNDLIVDGNQATIWEAFIGQRMDVPKDGVDVDSARVPKDIACAVETRFMSLPTNKYWKFRYVELELAEIIGTVNLQVYYCGRRTSYKKILDKQITAQTDSLTEEIFDPDDLINVYVPQYRTVRATEDTHDSDDNDTGIQTPYLRDRDKEFSLLITWTGQMAVTEVCMYLEPLPELGYNVGACEEDETTVRHITAEGTGEITEDPIPDNSYTNALISQYMSPMRARWVEFPSYDSATQNGVFFVDIPTFTPAPGGYPLTDFTPYKQVAITTEAVGTTIVYTLDGTEPTLTPLHGTIYTEPVQIFNVPTTLQAKGFRDGLIDSATATGVYSEAMVATPVFTPSDGQHPSADYPISVAITCSTLGATIRYTTNGAPVTTSSSVYSSPLDIDSGTTLRAKAYKTSYLDSAERTGTYTIQTQAAEPTFSPDGGDVLTFPQNVTISSTTSGAQIKYSINIPDVVNNGTVLTNGGVVSVNEADTLRAYAFKAGLANSDTKTATYTATPDTVAEPTLDPDGGSFIADSVTVTFHCSTPNVQMVYTIGVGAPPSDPVRTQTDNRVVDGDSIVLALGHKFVKVMAFADNTNDSPIHLAEFDRDR